MAKRRPADTGRSLHAPVVDIADGAAILAEARTGRTRRRRAPATATTTVSSDAADGVGPGCVRARARDQEDATTSRRSARSSWAPEHEPAAVVDGADVGAGSTVQRVEPRAAREAVVARPAIQHVVAVAAGQRRRSPGRRSPGRSPRPVEHVVTAPSADHVVGIGAPQDVGSRRSADRADRERLPIGREVRSLRRRQLQPVSPSDVTVKMSRLPPPAGKPTNAICVPSGDHDGIGLVVGPGRQVGLAGAIGVHHPDVRASAVAAPIERDARAVGRPRRVAVDLIAVRDALHRRAVRRDHVDLREPPGRVLENAMREPSGDHAGDRSSAVSLPPSVSCRFWVPSAFITKRRNGPPASVRLAYTICVPSGDHAGSRSVTAFRVSARRRCRRRSSRRRPVCPPRGAIGRTRCVRRRATRRDPSPGRCCPRGST